MNECGKLNGMFRFRVWITMQISFFSGRPLRSHSRKMGSGHWRGHRRSRRSKTIDYRLISTVPLPIPSLQYSFSCFLGAPFSICVGVCVSYYRLLSHSKSKFDADFMWDKEFVFEPSGRRNNCISRMCAGCVFVYYISLRKFGMNDQFRFFSGLLYCYLLI